jgi:hypothetical protein
MILHSAGQFVEYGVFQIMYTNLESAFARLLCSTALPACFARLLCPLALLDCLSDQCPGERKSAA